MSSRAATIPDDQATATPGSAPSTPVTAEAFAEGVLQALNGSALLLLLSLGHRAGLFDLLARSGPVTSEELARLAGMSERYLREWLAGLATSGVVVLHDDGRFSLPPEYVPLLTPGGTENLAVFAQYLPALAGVEDEILGCFREGGGVPYSAYPRFHEIMAEDSGQSVVDVLDELILPLVPGIRERLAAGIRVLDLGCGRGCALLEMATRYPASRFTGYDLSAEAIGWAREQAGERGLRNIRFEVRDLTDFDETAEPHAYDLVTTFDAVHDQAKPARLLRGIARTLRPDGVYLMQDIHAATDVRDNLAHPLGPFLYTVSLLHCMPVSLAQGGDGLGTMWGREQALRMLREAGFGKITVQQLPHDVMNDYYVARLA